MILIQSTVYYVNIINDFIRNRIMFQSNTVYYVNKIDFHPPPSITASKLSKATSDCGETPQCIFVIYPYDRMPN